MRRLTAFALLSGCAHAALLMPIPGVDIDPHLAGHLDATLSISLTAPMARVDAPEPAARKVSRRRDVTRHIAATASEPPNSTTDDTSVARYQADTTERLGSGADAHARVRSLLLTDLERHFNYPLLARRRGWEGTVWLAFVVAPDGGLERIHVARSSGYDALDVSALDALHRVGRLRGASPWLSGNPIEMQLPVMYRLRE